MKKLTLVYTLYNPLQSELESIANTINKSDENLLDFLIVSDNQNLNEKFTLFFLENTYKPYKITNAKRNLRKNMQIFENYKLIETEFIKICDPDDEINLKNIEKSIQELNLAENNSLVIHKQKSKKYILGVPVKYSHFKERSHNSNTIYPTNLFKSYGNNKPFLIWSDDFIGFFAVVNGFSISYNKKINFYINNRHNGVSTTKAEHTDNTFINETKIFLKEVNSIVGTDIEKRKIFNKITGKPNRWFYMQIINDMNFNSSLTLKEKNENFDEILKLSEPLLMKNINITKFKKMKKKLI